MSTRSRIQTFPRAFPLSTDVLVLFLIQPIATLVDPDNGETAVCGCHCSRDMTVRIYEVLARPWVGVCVRPSAPQANQKEMSHFLASVRACNLILHIRVVVS